eukprot:TRINITY_DN1082_c0_g1_i1.p1 TRINITY_DN1082_c0_g1~~TRINITY_DN1082_c0_g1_i1.p1  ORF type:complete len:230 (+),score=8.74 TRINITY_DN1082_c0_g1_i1:124-813(+)
MMCSRVMFLYLCLMVFPSFSNTDDWDYILVMARWPGTVANGNTLPSNVTSFTLHGLWPTRDDGSWPSYCTNQPFDPDAIQSLVPQLWESWYDYTGNGFDFWSHEWTKHGTCAESDTPMNSEFHYFSTAIQIIQKFDPLKSLSAAGITPNNTVSYSSDAVVTAFQNYFGCEPSVTCSDVSGVGSSIDTIQFCINKNLQLETCPSSLKSSLTKEDPTECDESVYLPVIQSE